MTASTFGTDYFVRDYAAPPSAAGTSWADAFGTIDDALAIIPSSGSHRVLVAAAQPGHAWKPGGGSVGAWGTWTGTPPSRFSTFLIDLDPPAALRMQGGYPADGIGDRCIWEHETVLSGDLKGDDSPLAGWELDTTNDENAIHVMTLIDVAANVILDGLTIERGNADDGRSELPDGIAQGQGGAGIFLTATPTGGTPENPVYGTFSEPVIQNCTLQLNSGLHGGAVVGGRHPVAEQFPLPKITIRTSTFRANRSTGDGSAIAVGLGEIEMAGSLVTSNRATGYGAVFLTADYAFDPEVPEEGIARGSFQNCTIADNESGATIAGVAWEYLFVPGDPDPGSEMTFASSILCLNRQMDGSGPADITLQRSAVVGGSGYLDSDDSALIDCVYPWSATVCPMTVSTVDPYFADAAAASPLDRDFHLHCCSFARDRGQPDTGDLPLDLFDADDDGIVNELLPDREWRARVESSGYSLGVPRVDAGAYEHAAPGCRFDLDGNGTVGASDLAMLLAMWSTPPDCPSLYPGVNICLESPEGTPPPCICLDIDRDSLIGAPELAVLLGAWGDCAPCESSPPPTCDPGLAESQSDSRATAQGAEQVTAPAPSVNSPIGLATLLGFESLESFAAWLATLPPQARAAVLAQLDEAGGAS